MQMPIRIRNAIRADLAILDSIVHCHVLRARDINAAVDNGMRNMDALGPEFTRQALAEGAHGELAGGERPAESRAFHGCCGAGYDQRGRMRGLGDGGEEEGEGVLGEVVESKSVD
jgi:hypothetical protein